MSYGHVTDPRSPSGIVVEKVSISYYTELIDLTYPPTSPPRGDGPPALCFFTDQHADFSFFLFRSKLGMRAGI